MSALKILALYDIASIYGNAYLGKHIILSAETKGGRGA